MLQSPCSLVGRQTSLPQRNLLPLAHKVSLHPSDVLRLRSIMPSAPGMTCNCTFLSGIVPFGFGSVSGRQVRESRLGPCFPSSEQSSHKPFGVCSSRMPGLGSVPTHTSPSWTSLSGGVGYWLPVTGCYW